MMGSQYIPVVYFIYGLTFYSMGLLVAIEGGRSSDPRLRRALRPLAGFGLIHGLHEWLEMFSLSGVQFGNTDLFIGFRLAILSFSFLSLAAFGSYLLAVSPTAQRLVMLVPLALEGVWVFGLVYFRGHYSPIEIWSVADVWTRYVIAIPASILTAIGLIIQQRAFRRAGLIRFGQDALLASVAFGWYGLVGQIFPIPSALPPSNVINSQLFQEWFGFPVQLFRAFVALGASVFVVRFLRAFQVEIDRQIAGLQLGRLLEAEERDKLRSELFKRIVAAQELERQRIARELHDETGQALTAIGMGLHGVSSSLHSSKTDQAVKGLRQLEMLTTQSLDELQRLILDLRPSHLDDLGLPSALRWYASDIEGRTKMQVRVEIQGAEREISPSIKTTVFRIVQEALTNVVKHAEAKNIEIRLLYGEDELSVRVQDDGRGFDMQTIGHGKRVTWGLKNIEERSTLLGGKFAITSHLGEGTIIDVSIPYIQEVTEAQNDNSLVTG
jgi:signal transduction histidine kinase